MTDDPSRDWDCATSKPSSLTFSKTMIARVPATKTAPASYFTDAKAQICSILFIVINKHDMESHVAIKINKVRHY